ncbi:hypothetical protein FRB99_003682 [Tulasnella sp. 403]|nr:hypothetical protein FRB99_003682 [Tulasnella sp. 403]
MEPDIARLAASRQLRAVMREVLAPRRKLVAGSTPDTVTTSLPDLGVFVNLPVEIWVVIIRHLRPKLYPSIVLQAWDRPQTSALRAVAATSRALRYLAEPYVYECIRLSGVFEEWKLKSDHIMDTVRSRPEVRGWVKYLFLDRFYHSMDVAGKITDFFVSLPSLRAIRMQLVTISLPMAVHMIRLPGLVCLATYNVTLAPDAPLPDFDPFSLHLTALSLRGGTPRIQNFSFAVLALSPHLERLDHGSTALPHIYNLPIQYPSHVFNNLREYRAIEPIDPTQLNDFFSFARSCPNLSSVTFEHRDEPLSPKVIPDVPGDILQHITSFTGSLSLASRLASGRQLTSLSIYDPNFSDLELLTELSRAVSATIRTVEVEAIVWTEGCVARLADAFASAEEFTFRYTRREGELTNYPNEELAAMSCLQKLKITRGRGTFNSTVVALRIADKQHDVVETLASQHPDLISVELTGGIRWTKSPAGKWSVKFFQYPPASLPALDTLI